MSNTKKSVIERARNWGFTCQLTEGDIWQISSPQTTETWQLSELKNEERWLLTVRDVPQVYLPCAEAIAFLERRRPFLPPKNPPSE